MTFDLTAFLPRAVMQGIPLLYGSTGENPYSTFVFYENLELDYFKCVKFLYPHSGILFRPL